MSPLQSVGMGLVVVVLDAAVGTVDLLHDLLGWLLVIAGLLRMPHLAGRRGLVTAAGLAAAVSVVLTVPAVAAALTDSVAWFLGLPQSLFLVLLAGALAGAVDDPGRARRLRALRAVLVGLALAPVLVLGGDLTVLLVPVAVVSVLSTVYLVVLVFGMHRSVAVRP